MLYVKKTDVCREAGIAQFKCKTSSNIQQYIFRITSWGVPLIWDLEEVSVQIFSLDESRWN